MIQLVLSILVSVGALAYHIHAVPYRETWLNMMQGACLFFIWLTLQAGAMVQNTLPDRNTGDAILVALSVANIVMLVSPVLLGLIAALACKSCPSPFVAGYRFFSSELKARQKTSLAPNAGSRTTHHRTSKGGRPSCCRHGHRPSTMLPAPRRPRSMPMRRTLN